MSSAMGFQLRLMDFLLSLPGPHDETPLLRRRTGTRARGCGSSARRYRQPQPPTRQHRKL